MEMVERVAKVIVEHFDNRWGQGPARVLESEAKLIARAAIEAMREPTDPMLIAGVHAMTKPVVGVADVFTSMIDAALI